MKKEFKNNCELCGIPLIILEIKIIGDPENLNTCKNCYIGLPTSHSDNMARIIRDFNKKPYSRAKKYFIKTYREPACRFCGSLFCNPHCSI